jgi:hypothetical protein
MVQTSNGKTQFEREDGKIEEGTRELAREPGLTVGILPLRSASVLSAQSSSAR